MFLISQTSHPLQTFHPQPHVPCKEGRALGKQKEGTKEKCGKSSVGQVLRTPGAGVGTCLETECLESSCQENRGWGNLSPYPDQNHALHSSGGKTLTLFEQLERGVSIAHLICVGAIKAPASEKGLQRALVPVDSNHSLTLPRRRGGPGRGRAGVSP